MFIMVLTIFGRILGIRAAMSPANINQLRTATNACLSEQGSGYCTEYADAHGAMGDWDVSKVQNMAKSKW